MPAGARAVECVTGKGAQPAEVRRRNASCEVGEREGVVTGGPGESRGWKWL